MSVLSVIVPCYNEEESVAIFYQELLKNEPFFAEKELELELIYVDDGSRDGTVAEVKKLHAQDERVHLVSFSRNFGKEAAMFAGFHKLDNLTVIVDNNNLQIDGTVEEVNSPYPIPEKFAAFGWNVIEIDGHSFDEIENALNNARECKGKPTAIIATTVKGKGVSFMENQVNWHGAAPNAEQYEIAMNELDAVLAGLEG